MLWVAVHTMCSYKSFKRRPVFINFLFIYLFYLHIWIFCLHVCMCIMHMPAVHGGEKKVLDHLVLKFRLGIEHEFSARAACALTTPAQCFYTFNIFLDLLNLEFLKWFLKES